MIKVLFAGGNDRWGQFETPLNDSFARLGVQADIALDHAPNETDYIIYAPNKDFADFGRFPKVKLVQSLWAGVEGIVIDKTLTQPLARMVDVGLTEGMVEWVTGHVLRHHLGMDRHIINPAKVLSTAEITVLLLPLTAGTENVLNSETLALMPKGAAIINPGRGPLIDDAALIAALDQGQISHATLDVFREEPLPQSNPFWAHPGVTVTPHIASETRAITAAQVVAENIARVEAGQAPLFLVDRSAGY